MEILVQGAYCSKRKEWFQGPSSDPVIRWNFRKLRLGDACNAERTEHNVSSTHEYDIEVVMSDSGVGPEDIVSAKFAIARQQAWLSLNRCKDRGRSDGEEVKRCTHLSIGMSLPGSMDGLLEPTLDMRLSISEGRLLEDLRSVIMKVDGEDGMRGYFSKTQMLNL